MLCLLLDLTLPGFLLGVQCLPPFYLSRVRRRRPVQTLLTPFSYLRQPDRAEIKTKDSTEELQGGKPEQLGQFYPSWETGPRPQRGWLPLTRKDGNTKLINH